MWRPSQGISQSQNDITSHAPNFLDPFKKSLEKAYRVFFDYGNDVAARLNLARLVTPARVLSDAAAFHTNETPFDHWDTLPPLTVFFFGTKCFFLT